MSWKVHVFLWWAINILGFDFVDLKSVDEGDDELEAITFSFSQDYINKVGNIE